MGRFSIILCFILFTTTLFAAENWQEHRVRENETLYGISSQYNIDIQQIMAANNLSDSRIREGQILRIPQTETGFYTVVSGDTIESISRNTGVSVSSLLRFNQITQDTVIYPGQRIRLSSPASGDTHRVASGETLSHIALRYRTTVAELRRINGLRSDTIREGQIILLPVSENAPQNTSETRHTVAEGETLWQLSRRFDIELSALIAANNLNGETIRPGQVLRIPDGEVTTVITEQPLLAYYDYFAQTETVDHKTGPYYNFSPRGTTQPSEFYMEETNRDPERNYHMAREVLRNMDRFIDQMKPLGNELNGYTIVLDPGHGGDDPGFLQGTTDGNDFSVFIAEDEYNYDITMRIYRLLKLHGADVELTIISPNHHIRSTPDPSLTFINEKNEVYNSSALNRRGQTVDFPDGNGSSLNKRMRVVNNSFSGVPVGKRLFVSIHLDHTPNRSGNPLILYDGLSSSDIENNMVFAETVALAMGRNASTRRQSLYMLRNNPAYAEILIEVRNVSDDNDNWAIRNEELREQDALKIVQGIINYAESER